MAGLLPNGMPSCSPNIIVELTHAVERTEMIYNAAKLRIFDAIEKVGKPVSSKELTREIGVPEGAAVHLERLLNVNTSFGLLKKTTETGEALFENTAESSVYLTTSSEFSLLTLVDAARHQFEIAEFIKENKTDGSRTWFYQVDKNEEAFRDIPHRFRRYYLKQDGYARTSIHLLKAFDLSSFQTAVDLGGGLGTLSRAMKRYYPDMEVTSYDMPMVVQMAKQLEEQQMYDVKIQYAEGDLFGDTPLPRADLYVIGHLLHMFKGDTVSQILNKVHASLNPGGAILVLEKVMDHNAEGPELCLMYDIRMGMSAGEGKERTSSEFDEIFTKNGFTCGEYRENPGYNCYDAIFSRKK